jgi:hypothetical protein
MNEREVANAILDYTSTLIAEEFAKFGMGSQVKR